MPSISDLDVHPCPYCNSSNLYIDEYVLKFRKGYCVTCYDCGMCGPVSFDSAEIAIKAWETLHRKMCRHCMDRLIQQNKKLHEEIRRLTGNG